jgi:hypothetical protein
MADHPADQLLAGGLVVLRRLFLAADCAILLCFSLARWRHFFSFLCVGTLGLRGPHLRLRASQDRETAEQKKLSPEFHIRNLS